MQDRLTADFVFINRSVTPPGFATPSKIGFAGFRRSIAGRRVGKASHCPEGGALNGEAGSRRLA